MAFQILPNAGHLSEFLTDPQSGAWLTGTCGETALTVAIGATKGQRADAASLLAIYHDMRARGLAAVNGASTLAGLAQEARAQGATILIEWDYAEPLPHDWAGVLAQYAGQQPIVLELANAQALTDVETSAHDEVGVKYHFIAIVGIQADGYVCADGDHPQVNQRYQIYSPATLQAAIPCGLLMLHCEVPTMSLPTGYHDDGTTLTAPNGMQLTGVIRAEWLSNPTKYGDPISATVMSPGYTEYLFYNGLMADAHGALIVGGAGQRAATLASSLAALQQQYDATEAQLVAAQASSSSSLSPSDAALLSAAKAFGAALTAAPISPKG